MSSLTPLPIFGHIPKTGGSTLRQILWQQYGGPGVFMSCYPGLHKARMDELRRELQVPEHAIRLILAHTGYGIHERLPDTYRYDYFTVLRDPVDRVVSHYYYQVQRKKWDPRKPIETFVREDPSRAWNTQTAFLGGLTMRRHLDGLDLQPEHFDEALLGRAKANLRGHAAVGLTERFDESVLLFETVFGWSRSRMPYVRWNRGSLRPRTRRLTPSALALIRAYNALDLELYRYACTLFDELLDTHLPDRDRALRTYGRMNAVYRKVYPVFYPVARTVAHAARFLTKRT